MNVWGNWNHINRNCFLVGSIFVHQPAHKIHFYFYCFVKSYVIFFVLYIFLDDPKISLDDYFVIN